MGQMILQTERLVLRELEQGDYAALCRILQDEEAMYAYEGAFSDGEAHEWLERQIARYKRWGFGAWAVILKKSGELIGQCGVTMQPWEKSEVPEVGYLFRRDCWHMGYATEAARACRDYAFARLNFSEVCSIIRDTNIPSQRVAQRNAMSPAGMCIKHFKGVDMPHIRYVITREEWEKMRGGSGAEYCFKDIL